MCNCNFVPMMMCCNCGGNSNVGGGGSTGMKGFKETVLYDRIINTVGDYILTDSIDNYDELCIVHATTTESTQYMTIPVSYIGKEIIVCHGDGAVSAYIRFKINANILNAFDMLNSYQIVKVIGRKY